MKNNSTTRGGINFLEAIGIVFITLRLCGLIDWPWVWVLAPIWGGICLGVLAILVVYLYDKWLDRKDDRYIERRRAMKEREAQMKR